MSSKQSNVSDVIIGTDFINPVAGDVDVTALTTGQFQAYNGNRDGAIGTSALLNFAQFDSNNGSRQSLAIPIRDIVRVTKQDYAAPTEQRVDVTIAATDVADNTTYALFVVDRNDHEEVNKWRFRAEFTTGTGATATQIAAGLVSSINDQYARMKAGLGVNASNAANVLTIYGVDDNNTLISPRQYVRQAWEQLFEVALIENLTSATTVVKAQTANPGCGVYDTVFKIEDFYKGYKGNMNRSEFVKYPVYYSVPGTTYTTYVIEHIANVRGSAQALNVGKSIITFLFLDSTNAAAVGNLDDLFLGTDPATDIDFPLNLEGF